MTLKARLRALQPTLIMHSGGANPDLVEMLCKLGCDAIYVDCERSPLDMGAVVDLRRAAQAAGVPVLVRSYTADPDMLVRYLDTGADGLIVPRVDTPEQARALVDVVRYACGGGTDQRVLVAQVESRAAAANIDGLLATEGVDAFFLGPMDIAFEMKRPVGDPAVIAVVDEVIARARAAGRAVGLPVTPQTISDAVAKGACYLSCRLPGVLQIGLDTTRRAIADGVSRSTAQEEAHASTPAL